MLFNVYEIKLVDRQGSNTVTGTGLDSIVKPRLFVILTLKDCGDKVTHGTLVVGVLLKKGEIGKFWKLKSVETELVFVFQRTVVKSLIQLGIEIEGQLKCISRFWYKFVEYEVYWNAGF